MAPTSSSSSGRQQQQRRERSRVLRNTPHGRASPTAAAQRRRRQAKCRALAAPTASVRPKRTAIVVLHATTTMTPAKLQHEGDLGRRRRRPRILSSSSSSRSTAGATNAAPSSLLFSSTSEINKNQFIDKQETASSQQNERLLDVVVGQLRVDTRGPASSSSSVSSISISTSKANNINKSGLAQSRRQKRLEHNTGLIGNRIDINKLTSDNTIGTEASSTTTTTTTTTNEIRIISNTNTINRQIRCPTHNRDESDRINMADISPTLTMQRQRLRQLQQQCNNTRLTDNFNNANGNGNGRGGNLNGSANQNNATASAAAASGKQYNQMDDIKLRSQVYNQIKWSRQCAWNETWISDDQALVLFHPRESRGTAVCWSDEPLPRTGNYYYWECQILNKAYGTSVMFGICTRGQQLYRNEFSNLIGLDKHGWSLSHKGLIWHSNQSRSYTVPFPAMGAVTVGLLFNSMTGELSYFMNGKNLGVAFIGLNEIQADLYPCVGSTAKNTAIVLLGAYSGRETLFLRSCFSILNNCHNHKQLLDYLENEYKLPANIINHLRQISSSRQRRLQLSSV